MTNNWLIWLKIGLRNLNKNRRRSLFTIGAISLGFAAVNIFGGFTTYVFRGLEYGFVYANGNGHLSIFKEGFLTEGQNNPFDYLLTPDDLDKIRLACADNPHVKVLAPELYLSGLISNGEVSTIYVSIGRNPDDTRKIMDYAQSSVRKITMYDGQPLEKEKKFGIGLAQGLADKLKLKKGDGAILMAATMDGAMNALDGEVFQLFHAPLDVLDDKMVYVTLGFAQSLYDTDGADRMNVLLSGSKVVHSMRDELEVRIREAGVPVEVHTWEELRPSFLRIRSMFRIIFLFVFCVVFVIVVLSVVNTISMTVMERTREIGTLRALGLRRRGVAVMFATESALLGIFGSILGLGLTMATWGLFEVIKPTWIPPNIPRRVAWEIIIVPEYLAFTPVCLILLSIVSAIVPARKAARMLIIDALGHV